MSDLVQRLRATGLDKDNFPNMKSERKLPVGLALEAADEIERLRAALSWLEDHEPLMVDAAREKFGIGAVLNIQQQSTGERST